MAAQDSRVERIYCALGGSASTDGGVGALMALSFDFLDSLGVSIGLGGGALSKIASISKTRAIKAPPGGVVLLVDVQSPLLGVKGAALIFSPQKGATEEQVVELENALQHFASIAKHADSAGSGAAGGSAFGLSALWGATIENGAVKIADLCEIDSALIGTDLVITGEGRLDSQSFQGKVVGHMSQRAAAVHVPIAYCVGSIEGDFPSTSVGGVSLSEIAGNAELAIRNPNKYLFEAGVKLANLV
jgi:glycerate kinase